MVNTPDGMFERLPVDGPPTPYLFAAGKRCQPRLIAQYGRAVSVMLLLVLFAACDPLYLLTTPVAPTNLTATAVSPPSVQLGWNDNSTNEDGFEIYRRDGSVGGLTLLTTVGANVQSYLDTTVDAQTSYTYEVAAYNSAGYGYSNQATVTTPGIPDPLSMTYVPGGTFQRDGTPTNTTTVSPFYMSTYEITQAQYVAVTGKPNPSYFPTGDDAPNRPVETVRWYDALVFCNILSIAEGKTPVYTIGGSTNPADWGEVPTTSDATWDAATMNLTADNLQT